VLTAFIIKSVSFTIECSLTLIGRRKGYSNLMITAKADKVIIEDYGHKHWVVYAKDGISIHRRKSYKSFKAAMEHANKLLHYYQVSMLTEISK